MSYRILPFMLFVIACEPVESSARVEVAMHGEDEGAARVVGSHDGDSLAPGTLYLNVVEVNARYEATSPETGCDGLKPEDDDDEVEGTDGDDGEEWWNLGEGFRTVNLSDGLSSHEDPIGVADLPPGVITELRLVLDEDTNATWVAIDGQQIDVKVPSGASSGLKLKGCAPIQAGYATIIDITADIEDAMHETGNGQWMLHPSLSVVASLEPDPPTAE